MGDSPSAKVTIHCSCGAALAVPASRAGAKVACPKCGTHLVIPAAAPAPAVPPPAGWYVSRDRKKVGPYTANQLRQLAAAGDLAPEDMVLREGQKQWVAADTIKGLFPDAPPPPPPPPPPPGRRKAPAEAPRSAARSREKAGPPWLLIGIGGVVLLAAGVGVGVFLATRGGGTPTPQIAEGPKPAAPTDPVKEKTPDEGGKEKTPQEGGKEKMPQEGGSTPTPPPPPPPPPPPETTPGTVKPPVAPVAGRRALDLRYVPAEAGAAVVVHPARILQSPLVKAAVPTAAADEMLKELGIRPEQIEQALVLLAPGPLVPPGATPPPPKDSWVELDSKEGRFALRFPAKPKQSERKTLLGTRQVHTAEVESAGLLFEIAYVDFPADSPIVGALSRVDFGTRALEFKPGFKNKKDLKLGTALGAEVVIDDTQLKTFSIHRVYVLGDRLYHLEATTRKGQAAPPEFERFFSSLRLPGAAAPSPAEMLPAELMPAPAAIVRFTEAIDGKPLLEKLLRGGKPAKHEGKDYLVGSGKDDILGIPVAGAQPDDRTVLLAPEPLLKKMLSAGEARSPLLDSLRSADGSDDLAVWVHPAPFRKVLALLGKPAGAMLPPPLAGAANLPDQLASLKLTANLRGKTLLQLTLDTEDAAAAPAVEKLVQAGQDLLQKLAPSLEPMLSAPGMPKAVQKELLAISEQLAGGLERTRNERRVQLTLSRPVRKAAGPLVSAFKPYLPQGAKDEVDLGGEVAAVEAGGGGRYLIYHLKAAKKLALFDVQQGKVVKQLPVLEDPMFFAANARQLAVLYPVRKLLILRDLDAPDTTRNLTLPAPLSTSEIGHVCMGSASAGPLFCYLPGNKSTVALDLAKQTVRPVQWAKWGPHNAYGPLSMRASADGRNLLGRGGGWAGLAMARFDNGRQGPEANNFAFSLGLFANVNADGQMVFYPDAVASGPDLQVAKAPPNTYLLPAAEPGFYLGLDCGSLPLSLPLGGQTKYPGVSKVTIFADNRSELLTLTDLPELKDETTVPWEKSVHYFPRGGLLVTLADRSKVVLRRLDLVERLKKTEVDYLFVMTQPATAKPGTTFTHRLDIRSRKDEGRQVKLVTGPDGLTVSADGVLSWAVPADFAEEEATALVSIRDATGQEILHPQRIRIVDE